MLISTFSQCTDFTMVSHGNYRAHLVHERENTRLKQLHTFLLLAVTYQIMEADAFCLWNHHIVFIV